MRRLLVALGAASAVLLGWQVAEAAPQTYYDNLAGKFVTYDVEQVMAAGKSGVRNYNPIQRMEVAYDGPYGAGTIVVNTEERQLYYVLGDGRAMKYGIGVGREGFTWSGTDRVSRKAEWPGWTPPAAMRKRVPGLPAYMPGGPENPHPCGSDDRNANREWSRARRPPRGGGFRRAVRRASTPDRETAGCSPP